jgi:hypothetical protein
MDDVLLWRLSPSQPYGVNGINCPLSDSAMVPLQAARRSVGRGVDPDNAGDFGSDVSVAVRQAG